MLRWSPGKRPGSGRLAHLKEKEETMRRILPRVWVAVVAVAVATLSVTAAARTLLPAFRGAAVS